MSRIIIKKLFPGISWRNPLFRFLFLLIDPLDYIVRLKRGWQYLPKYSIRVRSNGVNQQFGGKVFVYYGQLLASILQNYCEFDQPIRILEIGCGCGRVAIGLSALDKIDYTGVDIDRISLQAIRSIPIWKGKKFRFDLMDVYNNEYNPTGKFQASSYTFPYPNNSFDIVFLVSVFTHMLANDVMRYIQEISRMLKPGGSCMFTTFLMDYGRFFEGSELSFDFNDGYSYYCSQQMPEKTVGYSMDFFQSEFEKHGMILGTLLLGKWRRTPEIESNSDFSQDILFFRKLSKI